MRYKPLILLSAVTLLAACNPLDRRSPFKSDEKSKSLMEELKGPEVPSLNDAMLKSATQADTAGQHANAAQFYAQLADKNPGKKEYVLRMADALRKAGSYPQAISVYDKLRGDKEYNVSALEGIGLSHMAQGDFDEAGDALAEVMGLDSKRWRTINAIGILFTAKQMYPEARQYFVEALAQDPKNVSIRNNMALMEALDKQFDKSIELFREARKLSGKDDMLRKQLDLNLALVYAIKGDLNFAEETARPYLTEAQLLNNMGYYAHLAKDDNMAKSYLSMALTASDKHYEKAWKNLETLNRLVERAPR